MSGTSSSSRSSTSGRGQLLEQQVRARVEPHRVAAAQVHTAQPVGELADPLLVGAPDDEGAHAVVHQFLDRDHLAGDLRRAREHDVEGLVQHDLGAAGERLVVDLGMEPDAHLAAARQHVDCAVVVATDHHAVRRRRLAQLVDLVAQRGDVLASLAQGVAELLVLADRVRELALGLEQPLLERPHPLRRIGQASAQIGDLLLEHHDLSAQDIGILTVTGTVVLTVDGCHVRNLHASTQGSHAPDTHATRLQHGRPARVIRRGPKVPDAGRMLDGCGPTGTCPCTLPFVQPSADEPSIQENATP
jgi:hypothetical protein